ncbi:MAG TPA: acyl carrier protein [Candidatus Methylomirabilis sp.]|nr:acyl carrier protein [Candidatus Methylomirabilis sp.]
MTGQTPELREWSRNEVMAALRNILVESLGVKDEEVVASASVVRNLGAESIDFLDVSFQIQQTFGVNIQAAEIRDRIIAWGSLILPTLLEVLEGRYGVKLSPETLRPLEASGIEGVLAHLRVAHGISIQSGAADDVGRELLRRLIKEFTAFGFVVSEADEQDLLAIMRADLGTRRITERTMDLLTVGSLANFICAKLGPRLRAD